MSDKNCNVSCLRVFELSPDSAISITPPIPISAPVGFSPMCAPLSQYVTPLPPPPLLQPQPQATPRPPLSACNTLRQVRRRPPGVIFVWKILKYCRLLNRNQIWAPTEIFVFCGRTQDIITQFILFWQSISRTFLQTYLFTITRIWRDSFFRSH